MIGAPFVGRERERSELPRRLAPGEVLCVTGPLGVGKSRLVEEALPRARRVPLRDVADAGAAWDALASALGLAPGVDPIADVVGALASQREVETLWLDDADGVPPGLVQQLAEHLELPIVVTARRRLGLVGESLLELAPLDEVDAVALFDAWLERVRGRPASAAERPWLSALVQRLDGLPLALELAAARTRVLGLAALCRRLDESLAALCAPRDRERGLDAALQSTWEMLGPAERSALAQLTAFARDFDVDAAEAVLRLPPDAPTVLDVLQELRDRSLLVDASTPRGATRLRVLHVVGRFARQNVEAALVREAEVRHAAHYAERLDAPWHAPEELERRLEEREELLLAIDRLRTQHAPRSSEADAALRGLVGLAPLLLVRGPLHALASRLQPLLDVSARSGADLALLARASAAAARAHARLGAPEEARKALAMARLLAQKSGAARAELAVATVEVALALEEDPGPWLSELPDDPAGALVAARAHRARGALDEARAAARRALGGDRLVSLAAQVLLVTLGEPLATGALREEAEALGDLASLARLAASREGAAGVAAARALAERLGDAALRRELEATAGVTEHRLRVAADGSSFELDGAHVDLRARKALRGVLRALAEASEPLGWEALLEAGWPGERVGAEAAMQRVRVAVSTLRRLGLAAVIETVEGGYRFASGVHVALG